jgi:D-glycero-alpha-D-manno-heptose-7-phosphate kinase
MILVRAPLRLSFFGGGSDIPAYFEQHGGATLSATFDKWVYASLMPTPQPHVKVSYSQTEYHASADEVQHSIVREALRWFRVQRHIEISSFADIPTVGTGLGASSAFNVALVAGLERFKDKTTRPPSPAWITHIAGNIEIGKVGSPIGYQDHIAAAYGGMLFAEYHRVGSCSEMFTVTRLPIDTRALFDCLFLVKMPSRQISANQILRGGMSEPHVAQLVKHAHRAKAIIAQNDIPAFGSLLHDAWEEKKQMHGSITTPEIDDAYTRARRAGVLGGKLLGAGNGGYLLLCAPSLKDKLRIQHQVFGHETWYNVYPTMNGVEIVYDDSRNY